jgi:hypothetical protein
MRKITPICCARRIAQILFLVFGFLERKLGTLMSKLSSLCLILRRRWASKCYARWSEVLMNRVLQVSPSSSVLPLVLCSACCDFRQGAPLMEWTTPQHEEIDLNCEISSYANAEL